MLAALGACSGGTGAGGGPTVTAPRPLPPPTEVGPDATDEFVPTDSQLDELFPDPTGAAFSDAHDVPSSVMPTGAAHRKVLVTQQSLGPGWRSEVSDLQGGGPAGVLAFLAQDCIAPETRSALDRARSAWQLTAYPAGAEEGNVGYGALEARLFGGPEEASGVLALVRDLFDGGTGRTCLLDEIAGYYGVVTPDVVAGPSDLAGIAAGLKVTVSSPEGTYFVEMAARDAGGGCLVFATFVTANDPIDLIDASRLVANMVNG